MIFPLYWVVISSLKNTVELFRTPPTLFPLQIDWTPYITNFVQNQDMLHYMANSLYIALGTMILTLGLAAPIAYALARLPIRGKNVFLLVFLVAQMFPSIMLALPLFVMFTRIGLVNSQLAVILAVTTRTLPFAALILRPFFLTLPRELEDAAFIDGCTLWSAFYRIILPLSRSGMLTVAALTFLMGWSDFLFPLTLISDDSKRPLTLGLYKFISEYGSRWNDLMAVSTVAAIPIVLVFIFSQKYITSGLVAGAVKE
jgi:multiple sugar transport system permease protein